MDVEEALITIPINPNNFPAKLWRLVNSPNNRSIRWDTCGEGVIIDQQHFEAELLSPVKPDGEASDLFKTTNFTSFIRQLNLYGFRKVVLAPGNERPVERDLTLMDGIQHHFHNPNFKKDHPELLVNLKRLTSTNKAKLEAGLEVNCRPPSRFRRLLVNSPETDDRNQIEKQGTMFAGPIHRGLSRDRVVSHPYHRGLIQPKEYDRTPIPSRGWIMGHGDASSPTTFYTDKGIPVSVIRRFMTEPPCPVQPNPTTVHVQQGSQGVSVSGQKLNGFIPHHPQYRPGFYSAVCQCCPSGNMDKDMSSCAHQTPSSFPHYSYFQPNYQVGYLHPNNQNQDWQNEELQETKKNDVNLDTVFQIVDELQASPKLHMVKVETPEKHYHPAESHPECTVYSVSAQTSAQGDAGDSVNNTDMSIAKDSNTMASHGPVPMGGIIIAVPGNVPSGIAITVEGASNLPEAASEGTTEQRPSLPEPVESASTGVNQVNGNAVHHVESSDKALENDADTTIKLSDITQEDSNSRKQTKSPDLNMLVDVACEKDP
ncbi:heat shock factor protein 5 [Alosa sapidissima]|uniref:heat shock factor protein 5 n=1 Tax=Alosa sapidissima TaxID=34773 RepID=UPI001C08B72C|nr:heat shock factor protein 5 [Alosa sapidissima]